MEHMIVGFLDKFRTDHVRFWEVFCAIGMSGMRATPVRRLPSNAYSARHVENDTDWLREGGHMTAFRHYLHRRGPVSALR